MGEPELLAAPVVSSVAPTSGPPVGGTSVTITGTGFTGATSVRFAGQPATNIVVVSDTSITCKTPAQTEDEVVGISVTTPGGTGTSGLIFTYSGSTGTSDIFPAFIPIIPPPLIGNAQTIPTFPPPTPPPIGQVPVGPLVGPAIAPAGVPPSVAGVVQPQYKTGSATVPTAASLFPEFTTTTAYAGFPNNPPTGVPIVFSNISTNPSRSGGVWTVVPPPSTATIAQITLNGASNLTPHLFEAARNAGSIRLGHEEPTERSAGAVFPGGDATHLHQSQPTKSSRRKRLSESGPAGHSDNS
jgi:hypothetical protein